MEETSAVLHQSRVTELADHNSPAVLASMISEASGAGRWNEEVGKAQQELKKTREGLQEIQRNMDLLAKAVSMDDAQIKAMQRVQKVSSEAAIKAKQAMEFQNHKLLDLYENISKKEKELSIRKTELQNQKTLLRDKRSSLSQMKEGEILINDHLTESRCELLQAKAAKEEEKLLFERKVHFVEENTAVLDNYLQRQQSIDERLVHLRTQLKEKQELVNRLEIGLQLPSQSIRPGLPMQFYMEDLRSTIAVANHRLQEFKQQQQTIADVLSIIARGKVAKEKELSEWRAELTKVLACNPDYSLELVRLNNNIDSLQKEKSVCQKEREDLHRKQMLLRARLGTLVDDEASIPAWPLHSCFRFKEFNQEIQKCLSPLDVIAGSIQKICVTETAQDAAKLLQIWESDHRQTNFTRIWPLASLQITDRTTNQRQAQRDAAKGSIILPMELFTYEKRMENAIKRAFGGYVISTTDEVAKELISRHGVWNVTIDGKINRVGSVTGGWRGDTANSYISMKYEHDFVETQLAAKARQLDEIEKRIESSTKELDTLRAIKIQEEKLNNHIFNAEQQLEGLSREAIEKEQLLKEHKKMAALVEEEVERSKSRLQTMQCTPEKDRDREDVLNKALQEERIEESSLLNELGDVLSEQENLQFLQNRLSESLKDIDVAELKKGICSLEQEIADINNRLMEIEAAIEHSKMEERSRLSTMSSVSSDIADIERKIASEKDQITDLKRSLSQVEELKRKIEEDIKSLASLIKECIRHEPMDVDGLTDEQQYMACRRNLDRLVAELQNLKVVEKNVTIEEQVMFKERMEKLNMFKQYSASISESVNILVEGINKMRSLVEHANEATFQVIRETFIECCKILLPNISVDLAKVKSLVEDGVKLLFCNSQDSSSNTEWKSNLEELSGGQRTMLSLALVLTVAKSSGSCLYVMDEVDAALDQQNQERIAKLVKSVAARGSQIICVSHNVCFQRYCDTVIKVSMVNGSTLRQN